MPGSATRAAVGSSSLMLLSFRLGRLLDRRHVAGQRRAAHVTDLVAVVEAAGGGAWLGGVSHVTDLVAVVEAAGAVHRLAVVPHDEIAPAPGMRINKAGLYRMFRQIAQK